MRICCKITTGEKTYLGSRTVWSLYGVAAVMLLTIKNVSYNFLDVI